MKIITVDCNYVQEQFAASYLMIEEGVSGPRGFFVECNTNYAIPYLMEAALREGLAPDQIDGLVITHVHLDHAGGAGLFLQKFPNAKLYAHPRAAKHAIDPSKLIASATHVYGEAFMQKMYGTILPCPMERVVALEDGVPIDWMSVGGCLETKHLRGHANHHLCITEPKTKTLFSGDSFGVSYPIVNEKRGVVVMASTSPTDFDGPAAIQSVEWILNQGFLRVALTHYGFLIGAEISIAGMQLLDQLHFSQELLGRIKSEKLNDEQTFSAILDWTTQYFKSKNILLDDEDLKILSLDLKVNAQGLVFAANK